MQPNDMSDSDSATPKVNELDDAWAIALAEAEARARAGGRADIAAYLALRNSNDLLRKTACDWLLTTFQQIAGEMNRAGATLQMSKEDNYHFTIANATMVGQLLKFERGVRQLLVEVGWPRLPRHGFIRGGGLALGRLRHLGIKSASEEIRLLAGATGDPSWVVIDSRDPPVEIHEANIRQHIADLLNDSLVEEK